MPNQIDGITKKCRVKEVIALSDKYENLYYQSKIGNVYDGIVETRKDSTKIVITTNYIPVEIKENLENNTPVKIKITEVNDLNVNGILIQEK